MTGRPTIYSEELADAICDMMASGMSVREIGRRDDMPDARTINRWSTTPDHPFCPRYVLARRLQAQAWADECLEIADDGTNDWVERALKDGGKTVLLDREHVMRSNLRVDTRKWLLAKLHPELFAERTGMIGPDGKLVDPTKRTHAVEDQRGSVLDLIASALTKAKDSPDGD